jgi:cytochrome c oxidase cbb3-type subunit 3
MNRNAHHFRARGFLETPHVPMGARIACSAAIAFFAAAFLMSCKREQRSFDVPPAAAEESADVPWQGSVRPGPTTGPTATTTQPVDIYRLARENFARDFTNNAQALSDGQRLYEQFNCVGCHAHGGGGMGPPLLDPKWFYGGDPKDVYLSILQGRPHGMPSFRGRIPDYEIWELTAYVRSLSGQSSSNAASGREEHMTAELPPNSMPKATTQKVPEPTTGPATNEVGN